MGTNFHEYVPLRTMRKTVEAAYYNRVRLALLRLDDPLHLELPRLRLEFVVDRKAWVGLSLVNDLPVLAWTDFAVHGRALHEPVSCRLHLYHMHAGLLMGTALDALDAGLKERLEPLRMPVA